MKTFLTLLFFTLALAPQANAQKTTHRRICRSHEHLQQQLAASPAMRASRTALEQRTKQFAQGNPGHLLQRGTPTYVIPIVFHVVYRTAAENISDAQIMSQLNILNQDFQKLNADTNLVPAAFRSVYADCKIQFCLAQRDPNGNATTGITRKLTTVASWSDDDRIKNAATGGTTTWDASRYLNVWIGNLGNGLLGYAQFPGGPAATDGVVNNYSATGNIGTAAAPFNKGRTLTHEVGHYFNLYHIWGDDGGACTGSDEVGDTPNQDDANSGCPSFPQLSCSSGANGEMFMNYMDYTDDACMMMFTNGQRTRMYATLQPGGPRASLLSSNACTPPAVACTVPTLVGADSLSATTVRLRWRRVAGAVGYVVQWKTAAAASYTSRTVVGTDTVLRLSGLTAATSYNFVVRTRCTATDSSALSAAGSFSTAALPPTCQPTASASATNITTSSARLVWRRATAAQSYVVLYKTAAAASFSRATTVDTFLNLTGLAAGTTYQYQLRTRCSATDSSALTTLASFATTALPVPCAAPAATTVDKITGSGARLTWRRAANAQSYVVLYKTAAAASFLRATTMDTSLTLTGLAASTMYQFQLRSRCSALDSSVLTTVASFTTSAVACSDPFEANNTLATARAITLNTDLRALIANATDQDYYSFATTTTARNIKITLRGLPDDYDVRLLNSSGTELRRSENADTVAETIVFNTTVAGSYRLHIYGYGGAYSATRCYTFRVATSSATQSRLSSELDLPKLPTTKAGLSISPQPANTAARIDARGQLTGKCELMVSNASGLRMMTQTLMLDGGVATIDVSRLPNGLYFVQVSNGEKMFTQKLLVQR